ncbi:MAG TPA: hypothetical protein VK175_01270 [Leadbetterella sp.]|nr:hypothetical protein [Leadbetterella sp.]
MPKNIIFRLPIKNNLGKKIVLLLFLVFLFNLSFAQANAEKTPQWYEIIGGILAIPATAIGIIYSVALIKKTKLETEKAKLEIQEKQKQLNEQFKAESLETKLLIEPIIQANQVQLIILRFILLYVTLEVLGLAISAYNFLTGGIFLGIQTLDTDLIQNKFILIGFYIVSNLPQIARWTIIIGLGLPLFKDTSKILNIDPKEFILPWREKTK